MADTNSNDSPSIADVWHKLRLPERSGERAPLKNLNEEHEKQLSPLDKAALWITDHVGSMGFFLIILGWTIFWCGYNIIATELPGVGLKPFDPFPAFVAYLLISNVIQILLMPLIMVGQNVQSRHSELRAEMDFEINQRAEKEVIEILKGLEHNTELLIQLMKHMDCRVNEQEVKLLQATAAATAAAKA